MNDTSWLLVCSAAEYLQMHPDTVRELYRRGDIKAVKRGKSWRTKREWLDEYLVGDAA